MPQQPTPARTPGQFAPPPDPYSHDPWSWAFVIFRPVPGYPGYGADTDGFVWSCRTPGFGGHDRRPVWRRLRQTPRRDGYPVVSLHRDGKQRVRPVHRVILETFIGPRPAGMDGCHNNGQRTDCRLVNLRWDTRKGNLSDMRRHGTARWGSRCPFAKLTEPDVAEIRRQRDAGTPRREVARHFGISEENVRVIELGRTWTHVGFNWGD